MATEILERRAAFTGLGMSQMGRRVERTPMDLTLDAVLEAIADAGLQKSDIDGIATLGEVPSSDIQDALRIETNWSGGGMSFGGLLSPVAQACQAVASGL